MAEKLRQSLLNNTQFYPLLKEEKKDSRIGDKGFKVGTIWPSRQSMCDDGVHTSNFAGIAKAGGVAVSVVLSGKYEDDSDEGEVVWYTGTGGRDDDGSWGGSGPQTKDQSFSHADNGALRTSHYNHVPIRLIRAIEPSVGSSRNKHFRFDGMYDVTEATLGKGKRGFVICRFKFVRQRNQALMPR